TRRLGQDGLAWRKGPQRLGFCSPNGFSNGVGLIFGIKGDRATHGSSSNNEFERERLSRYGSVSSNQSVRAQQSNTILVGYQTACRSHRRFIENFRIRLTWSIQRQTTLGII